MIKVKFNGIIKLKRFILMLNVVSIIGGMIVSTIQTNKIIKEVRKNKL